MRIGILTHNYPRNSREQIGAEVFVYSFARLLKKEGHEVFVFCPSYSGKKEKYKDVPVTWFYWHDDNKKMGDLSLANISSLFWISIMVLKGGFEVLKFIQTNDIDVIISMWAFPAGFWAMIGKFFAGKPSVIISMGSDIFVYPKILPIKWLTGFILMMGDLVYGNGYKICRRIKEISGRKALFFPITASNLPFKYAMKIKMDTKKFNFIYVGRLEPVKGPDVLFEATKKLRRKVDNFVVYLAGPGTMFEDLKVKVKKDRLDENFKLLGPVYDRKKVAGLFLQADSLVMASRSESTPFTVIEAINAKLPIVVTDVGDMGKIASDFKIGFVAPAEDATALADEMFKIIKKGKGFKKKIAKNFKKPKEIYDTYKSTKKMLLKVEELL
ncbi:MAG TPA: glycosyltransferase family 4 protein [Patescibacteria group bacterium]|nr:glycosyltransferase family 4 protein [Patescibacteria group bacterium]